MYLRRQISRGGQAALAAMLVAGVLMAFHADPARAQSAAAGDTAVFTVRDVPVDVTADTAAEARRRALEEGQRAALDRMLQRLTRRVDHAALPSVDAASIGDFVLGIEVANEKTSSVRYLADLTVEFKPAEIRNLLRQTGLPFAETAGQPVVVLPVLRTPDGLFLWDASNRWLAAWGGLTLRRGLVPIIVPLGDLADISDIDAAQAMLGDADAISAIAVRYGAADALVALATLSEREGGLVSLDVAASRPNDPAAAPILLGFTASSAAEIDEIMRTAALETVAGMEDAWLDAHLLRFDSVRFISLVVPVDNAGQWATVRRRLDAVPEISRIDLRVLRRGSVEVDVEYFGDEAQLTTALGRQGLDLEPPLPSLSVPEHGSVGVTSGEADQHTPRVLRPRGS